ncbi:MAG: FmdB family zinc ribbon protein [Streptosporangiaceae bacterium]
MQKFTDDSLSVCATCGGRLRKVFSPVGIVFKGSGFYRTDSRAGSATDGKPAMEKAVNGSPAAGDSGAAAKSGSGAAAATSPLATSLLATSLLATSLLATSPARRPAPRRPARPQPRPRRARKSPDRPWPTWPASGSSAGPGSTSSLTRRTRLRSRPRLACRATGW